MHKCDSAITPEMLQVTAESHADNSSSWMAHPRFIWQLHDQGLQLLQVVTAQLVLYCCS